MESRVLSRRLIILAVSAFVASCILCLAVAVFLLEEQSASAARLRRGIFLWREISELKESMTDLAELLRDRIEGVNSVNERVAVHIERVREALPTPRTRELVLQLSDGFTRYLDAWRKLATAAPADHERLLAETSKILETDANRACDELESHLDLWIEDTEREHRQVIRALAWGLVFIGVAAALSGAFVGFAVARGLSRSIRQIQFQIQDATGKLNPRFPLIDLPSGGDWNQVQVQFQVLHAQIERTVEQLQEREREASRADQLAAVGQLAAGVAHEIRNPLTSIKLLVQAGIENAETEPMSREDLQIVEREARRMEQSLQAFLDFARPPQLRKHPCDVRGIIARTAELLRGRAQKQEVAIRYDEGGEVATIDADATQVQQVLVNLGLNALDAMPDGGELRFSVGSEPGRLVLQVLDTGTGVPPEMRERLFRPFASSKETGLGLGLVICRRIIEDHGGRIEFRDRGGRGACFRIELPVSEGGER
jgi:two-component system sensor histidine kinase HydH